MKIKSFYIQSVIPFLFILSSTILLAQDKYAVIKLEGTVNPIIAAHISKSIQQANNDKAQFIILQMDTPGGMMTSMREIIKSIMSSEIPVVVYTFPKGAQAASAGGYIMLSAHIAVMSPGTEIGAMHPVSPFLKFGQEDKDGKKKNGVMEKKVLNDTIAYARSLAQKRNRNVQWAVNAVKDAISSTYIEAKDKGVIDFIAEDMNDLLLKLDGRRVNVGGRQVVLSTANTSKISYAMDWKEQILNFFADPQVVFFLFIITIVGIWMELKNPGMIVPGVIGGISFFIFLMAIRVLPINFFGLSLIFLSIVLFILELSIISYGLLTLGGIISFVFGSIILFDSPLPGFQIPISSIITVVIFLLFFVFVVLKSILTVHKDKVSTGMQGLVGETAVALMNFSKKGKIFVHGEIWNARSSDEIKKDDTVIVDEVDGLTLIVKKDING